MQLSKIERVKKICKWLIFEGYAENETELANLLGYNRTSFSQFLNEKKPLTDKFISKLNSIDNRINTDYINNGGKILLQEYDIDFFISLKSENELLRENREFLLSKVKELEEKIKSLSKK